jgi:hypothetical protein
VKENWILRRQLRGFGFIRPASPQSPITNPQVYLFKNIVRRLHNLCTVPQQRVRARIAAAENVAGHREDFAALVERVPRCNQRAALPGGFDHDDGEREAADDAVTLRKIRRQRRGAGGKLADQRAALADAQGELRMFGRINDVDAATEHGHGDAAGLEGAQVRRRIHAARHAADDGDISVSQVPAETARHLDGVRRCGSRSNDCHHRPAQTFRMASRPKDWRWIRNGGERPGIAGIAERKRADLIQVHRSTPTSE